jgi:fucose 4-O-acetylase-like acetyltransferase
MLAILYDHTEIYYTGTNIIDYNAYVVDALIVFFFLSGYLFFKAQEFNLWHKLHSILRGLVIPYFFFTTVIALPKALVHNENFEIESIAENILLGNASWFVAALIVAELLFALILQVFKDKVFPIVLLSCLCFIASVWLPRSGQPYPWNIDNALQAVLFLCGGYYFHRYEQFLSHWLSVKYVVLALTLLVLLKAIVYIHGDSLMVYPIAISNYPAYLLNAFLAVWFLVGLSRLLPHCSIIEWTGQRSIVYYFFCGGVPLLISRMVNSVGLAYSGHYIRIIVVFIIVYLLTSAIAWFVYRFMPCIIGKKRKKHNSLLNNNMLM